LQYKPPKIALANLHIYDNHEILLIRKPPKIMKFNIHDVD